MIILDAHCDTISEVLEKRYDLFENNGQLDLKRLNESKNRIQFFAAFIKPGYPGDALYQAVRLIDTLIQSSKQYHEYIEVAYKFEDVLRIIESGKTAAIMTIEGGDALLGDLSVLRIFYRLGVRALGLTWNHRNQIADGVIDDSGGGLTPFGNSVIAEMNSLGMIIDVSHINNKGFWDCINLTKQPIIASHSNAKSLCSHKRNLDDLQLMALKNNGGVVGINFCPAFLNDSYDTMDVTIDDVLKHIEYISGLIGSEHLGLGSDYDGISYTPKGLEGTECILELINRLLKLNYTEDQVKGIASENFLRVFKNVVG